MRGRLLVGACDSQNKMEWFVATGNSLAFWVSSVPQNMYTQTKVKQYHILFGETVLKVAERKMLVMEIKYFEFYCKFYYFFEHLELKMIL